jgi:hypothetical protein
MSFREGPTPTAQFPRRNEPVEKVGFRSIGGVKSGSEASKIVPLALKRGSEAGAGEFFNSLTSLYSII